ncbi:MAG TPA: M50 family metallopeptidase [Candidatus Aquilonibacter sp.]|nr:M50 family metallopeptidase [Candidatus Aquilonibacter sp.]
MLGLSRNSIRLFRILGIDVFLHWSWFLVALFEIQSRADAYSSIAWNVLEYLALFLIVLLHEFGHALACRQVGGTANQIVLWPLGGVAYVSPPPRPAAVLWSIVAGPLVNVALIPVLLLTGAATESLGLDQAAPSFHPFLHAVATINIALLIFNVLPIYPLDGGKILWSLLWFVLGRARSLMVATIVGFIGAAGLIALAILARSAWLGILCAFLLLNCWTGLRSAFSMARRERGPRHADYACPSCKAAPHIGNYWLCPQCKKPFDTFATKAECPACRTSFATTRCPTCGESSPIASWTVPSGASSPAPIG